MLVDAARFVSTLLMAAGLATPAVAEFQDPLDVPAMQLRRFAGSPMTAVASAGNRLVAVGRRGLILVSEDGGQNWRQIAVPTSVDLTAVHFTSASNGWVVGHGGIVLHSTDGGLTWERNLDGRKVAALLGSYYEQRVKEGDREAARILPDAQRLAEEGPVHPFLDVWFENEKVGYVVGVFNLILQTVDGGQTWIPWLERTENPGALHLYGVRGVAGVAYIVGEQGLVLKLDSREQRFRKVSLPYSGTLFGVLVRQDFVLVYGLRGNAYRSTDSAKTWHKVDTPIQTALTGAAELPDGKIAFVSQGGNVLVSANRGQAFEMVAIAKPMPFAGVANAGENGLALVGLQGVSTAPAK